MIGKFHFARHLPGRLGNSADDGCWDEEKSAAGNEDNGAVGKDSQAERIINLWAHGRISYKPDACMTQACGLR